MVLCKQLIGLVLPLGTLQAVTPAHPAEEGVHGTPTAFGERIDIADGFAYLAAYVNGNGPFRFLIDTASTLSSLRPEAARKAGLEFDREFVITSFSGDKLVPGASAARIRAGDIQVFGVAVAAFEMPRKTSHADGILGQSFLSKLPFMVDYQRQRLFLGDVAARESDGLTQPLTTQAARFRPVVPVVIEPGVRILRLVLDSAVNDMIVQCQDCPRLSRAHSDTVTTMTGHLTVTVGTLKSVSVGGAKITHPGLVLIESPPRDQEDGVLPASWFSAIYVDGSRNVVRLGKYVGP